MVLQEKAGIKEKLAILADAAKYDVACTSSGVSRKGKKGMLGSCEAAGVCHSFSADGRCISLLKILYTNECIYNCKYCINRCTNDVPRATFITGRSLFLNDGILSQKLYRRTIFKLRNRRVAGLYNGADL